jgi:type 1 glutamine amidotransferase
MGRCLILLVLLAGCSTPKNLVVFSKTAGYRHDSIPNGIEAIRSIGEDLGYTVVATEDASMIIDETYDVLVFLSPTGDVLNEKQQQHLQSFVEQGGGFVGIHSATNCEEEFAWYCDTLVCAIFAFHRQIKPLEVHVVDGNHPSTRHLQDPWNRTDEWYNYDRVPKNVTVLLEIEDEDGRRPIAWCRSIKQGRSFYTGGGHTKESYAEPQFLMHLKGGIEWVAKK